MIALWDEAKPDRIVQKDRKRYALFIRDEKEFWTVVACKTCRHRENCDRKEEGCERWERKK